MKNVLFFWLIINLTMAQTYENLREKINNILNDVPQSTKLGLMIYNPETKDTIYSRLPSRLLIPASNTKLFTTSVALSLMGRDFTINTALYCDSIDDGGNIIKGNLYLKGFGDPTLSESDIDSLVLKIYNAGIKKIEGNIVGDDTYFDDIYSREDWITDEYKNVPLPPVSALALNRNNLEIVVNSNKPNGSIPDIHLSPNSSLIKKLTTLKVSSRRGKPKISFNIDKNSYKLSITGSIKRKKFNSYYSVQVGNPSLFAAVILYEKLKKIGIQIEGGATTGITPDDTQIVASVEKPIDRILSIANKKSDNFVAECIFKAIGAFYSKKQGNSFYSTQAVLGFLVNNSIYNENVEIVDGSGISRYNKVTVKTITELLERMYNNPNLFELFYNTLAIAGEDGTLRRRFDGNSETVTFRGKTGTLRGVCSLSGYLTTANDTDLIFSYIAEFERGSAEYYKSIQDKILELLSEEL